MTQKFFRGDLVRIADDLSPMKRHFDKGCEAVVMYTYAEAYSAGRKNEKEYCLYVLPDRGEISWYDEEDLTLVEPDTGWKKMPKNSLMRKNEEAREARKAA